MAAGERGPLRRLAPVLAAAGVLAALALFFAVLPTPASREGGTAADPARAELHQPPSSTFAVTGARVFDGEEVLPRADVLVEEGRIAAVGPDLEIPAGVPRVDGTGRTLLPGLVDAHVHVFGNALAHSLRFGVTTVLDMFTDPGWAAGVKERQARDGNPGEADLFSAGYLATAPGGHGTQFGLPVPTVDGETDPEAWVAARLEEGSDWVKIVVEDGRSHGADLPTLSPSRVKALVRAAHHHGVLAVAHVGTAAEARTALAAGVDGLAHLVVDRPLDDDLVRLAADAGVFVVPTLTVLESVTGGRGSAALAEDPRLAGRLTREQTAGLVRAFPAGNGAGELAHALESTRRLAAAGVPLLAGSDAPNPGTAHGASLHRELELLVEAGLSPVEALAAATSVPADAFGLPDRGRISPGRRADLVLVEGDPTRDVTATRALRAVWKAGRPVELASPAPAAGGPGGGADRSRVEPGPVSDFQSGPEPSARIGSRRWFPSTDERMGGASTVSLAVEYGALRLRGEVVRSFAYPWAGAFLPTSPEPPGAAGEMAPADLSAATGLAFRARAGTVGSTGDARTLRLYLFSRELGPVPAVHGLPVGPDWRHHRVPFSALGVDGSAVSGILLGAGPDPGPFELWIDDVVLYVDPPDGERPGGERSGGDAPGRPGAGGR